LRVLQLVQTAQNKGLEARIADRSQLAAEMLHGKPLISVTSVYLDHIRAQIVHALAQGKKPGQVAASSVSAA
jgi:hypothetical protein